MAISFISCNHAVISGGGTLPTHIAGDLIVGTFYSSGETPTVLPSGWETVEWLYQPSSNKRTALIAYTIAESSETNLVGTTDLSLALVGVYRGANSVGAHAINASTSSSISQPALSPVKQDGTSMVVRTIKAGSYFNSKPAVYAGYTERYYNNYSGVFVDSGATPINSDETTQNVAGLVNSSTTAYATAVELLAGEPEPPTGIIKAYNGTEFVDGKVKGYNGSTWVDTKAWNGSEWK